jgi:hypothetical protein
MNLLSLCKPHTNFVHLDMILPDRNLYFHNVHDIPPTIRDSVKLATVEFAELSLKHMQHQEMNTYNISVKELSDGFWSPIIMTCMHTGIPLDYGYRS